MSTADVGTIERLRQAALQQPGARERSSGMVKFQCSACAAEGHDEHLDNAGLFLRDGTWGCAYASGDPTRGRSHWEAIGRALGAFNRLAAPPSNGHGVAGSVPSVWDGAITVPDFLAQIDDAVAFLEPRLLVRGAITELFAPRGLGKTQVAYAIALPLARAGLRVLLVDRDNPRHEVRRRLRHWGGADAATFKMIGRDKAPALTDAPAWQAFPLDTYDLVIIDSIDAATEGVGEGDSAKPATALAAVLDLARRADGPAILVLGNVIKAGTHSRGCGVLEDRADIVFEARDATDLKPTGTKDWWHELPPADVGSWAQRASRRRRRDTYRLAFIPTKFRLGEEPDPFIFEIDHTSDPWMLREVTDEVVRTGEATRQQAGVEREQTLERAALALQVEIARRADAGESPLYKGEAEKLLQAHGLTQKAARTLVAEAAGRVWKFQPHGTRILVVSLARAREILTPTTTTDNETTPRQTTFSETPNLVGRINTGQRDPASQNPASTAGKRETLSSSSPRNIHSKRTRDDEMEPG